MDPEKRDAIGPFRVEGLIGSGGMGVVYRAIGPDGSVVAVKVLAPKRSRGDTSLRRFLREAQIRIEHPNVVQVLDAGEDDGTPWIAFELLEGEPLRALLSRGPMAPADAVDLAVQACRGIATAHERGIIHRDLKPGNLFRCEDGTLKVLDFGVARWEEVDPELTTDNQVIGTPAYLSPEQARGESDIDERTDVWALGVLLYEALSGRRAFRRGSQVATMLAVVLDEPPSLARLAPHFPPELVEVVHRAFRKPRAARWSSVDAFADALSQIDLSSVPAAIATAERRRPEGTTVTAQQRSGPSRASTGIALDEKRVVAILLSQGVRNARALEEIVLKRGGAFVPLLGRRAIGVFGGESLEGDEIVRAARAGLLARRHADRVSVAAGRVSARGDDGIAGEAILEAEEACKMGVGGVAVLGETARVLARSGFEVRRIPGGLAELIGEREVEGEAELATPTVGRDVEIALLARTMSTCFDDARARVILITGPPGCGKSRMRRELERIVGGEHPTAEVLVGRAEPLHKDTALSLIARAILNFARRAAAERDWGSLERSATSERRRDAIVALAQHALGNEDERRVRQTAGFLGALLGVAMDDETADLSSPLGDARLMNDQLHLAVYELLDGLTARGPVALLLEDLQWSDPSSLDIVDELLYRLSDRPFFVFGTARPELTERAPRLFAGHDSLPVELPRLSARDVGRLAAGLVGREVQEELAATIADRTGGNPLFVEQIVLRLDEEGLLDRPPSRLPMPRTVEMAVQSRLDHLPHEEKELCKRLALFGRPIPPPTLEGLGVENAERLLGSLRRRGVVLAGARSRDASEREFRFRSSLVRDVAYRMLSDDLRAELHHRAAELLVRRGGHSAEECAVHYERAGLHREAGAWYAEASLAAAQKGDSATVLRCAERAEQLGAPADRAFELYIARSEALGFLGRREDQGLALGDALHHARNDRQRARVLIAQATWRTRTSRLKDALKVSAEAVDAADLVADPELQVLARVRRVLALIFSGDLDDARKVLAEAQPLLQDVSVHMQAFAAEAHAHLATARGDLAARQRAFVDTAKLFHRAGDVRRAAANQSNLADTYNRVGGYAEAVDALREALDGCRKVGNQLGECYALLNLAYALGMMRRVDDALAALGQARELSPIREDRRLELILRMYRARVLLQGAEGEVADELAAEAEQLARDAAASDMTAIRVSALTIAAQAHLLRGAVEEALEASGTAMEGRDKLGSMEEDEAEVFLARAAALGAAGKKEEAADVVTRGQSRLNYIAARIGNKEWRRRFVEDVGAHRELMNA